MAKRGLKIGKKIERLNALFRACPKSHKTSFYYRQLCAAAGIPDATIDKHCSVALSLIEGAN